MNRRTSFARIRFGASITTLMRAVVALVLVLSACPAVAYAQTGSITGTVTAAGSGTPLAGVYAHLYNASGPFLGSTVTNASGVYSSTGLAAGTYYVRTWFNPTLSRVSITPGVETGAPDLTETRRGRREPPGTMIHSPSQGMQYRF